MELEQHNVESTGIVTASPGEMLRQARENRRMSLGEIAEQLHLTEKTISDIESDHYPNPSDFTFIRGYLRAYAKWVQVDPDTVIEYFNRQQGMTHQTYVNKIVPNHSVMVSRDPRFRLLSYVISFLLVCLMVIWWHSHSSAPVAPVAENSVPPAIPTQIGGETVVLPKPKTVVKNNEVPPELPAGISVEIPANTKSPENG